MPDVLNAVRALVLLAVHIDIEILTHEKDFGFKVVPVTNSNP